ncbi:hypothetical protein [uncultured Dokdonia sp.]|uniref:hypothetical protein n=1 Tax=uncultured Dokdonia sp. TaxID=575653 RepID=UPI00260F1A70|nr:hypothetical protein [uncultured Dokdonia sp.]
MEQEQHTKRKSSNQKRFENSRGHYTDRQILMELLYNARVSRDTDLKVAKNTKTLVYLGIAILLTLNVGVLFYVKTNS